MKSLLLVVFFSSAAWAEGVISSDYQWRGLLIAGDHSIENFDNGRKRLGTLFDEFGFQREFQQHFTSTEAELTPSVLPATLDQISGGFQSLQVQSSQTSSNRACLVHMTSHGMRNRGFYLSLEGDSPLTPNYLSQQVNSHCGEQPTVILISACFSGQFITEELVGPNRVILTAAVDDRPSFGCSPDYEFTFWDNCLINELESSETWTDLSENINSCIREREADQGFRPSLPQVFIGENMVDSRILHK